MAQYGKASYWDERYTKYAACAHCFGMGSGL